MAKARDLVLNIRKRRLYRHVILSLSICTIHRLLKLHAFHLCAHRFVDEFILPMEVSGVVPKVTPAMVSGHNPMPVDLRPEHIIVHDHVLNYGSKVWS